MFTIFAAAAVLCCSEIANAQSFVNWESPHVNPIALTPDGRVLAAVNTADNRVEMFSVLRGPRQGQLMHTASIPVGLDPVSIRARGNSELWVVNHVSDSISIINLPTARVFATINTADEPCDVVFAGSPQRAFVSVSQLNQVVVYDPENLAAAPVVIPIAGEDPRALAVSPDGMTVYAAIFESGNKSTIIGRQQVSQGGGPYGGLNPPPNSGNAFSPPVAAGLPPPPPVSHIVKQNAAGQWMDDNNRNWSALVNWGLHDHDIAIINASNLSVTYASGLMNMVANVAVSPAGIVSAVGTDALNEVRFEENVNSIFVRCNIASFNPASPGNVSVADMNPHLNYQARNIPPAQRNLSIGDPRGIVWHPSGAKAYVSGMGSNNVIATDATGSRLALINVGQGPTGLAISNDGSRLYVLNKFEGSVSIIDTNSNMELSRSSFFDPTPASIKLGRPFLYDTHLTSGLGQASCASCHIDGRTDHLAWDLGDPAGAVILFNQTCQAPPNAPPPTCGNWHPMKGPMVTQTLQGIIGNEPFHWRGEKTNLAAFNPAYTNLQGRDSQISAQEMARLQDFVATISYPPNPNRNLDNSLKTAMPVTGGTGNAVTGRNLFQTLPVLPGGLTCAGCHALPDGTNNRIDIPVADPQNRKNAQLRNMHEKTGFDRASPSNNRGFGYNHDGVADNLAVLLNTSGFQFAPGPQGAQQRRDIEAFLLSFSVDVHAGVGAQTTVSNGLNVPAAQQNLINQMIALANANAVGLVVKGRRSGMDRGYRYNNGGSIFQSDRASETLTAAQLLATAANGSELTYTLVPLGSQTRIGIDRDSDGFFDRDELDACSDPANPAVTPLHLCRADIAPPGGNGTVNIDDLFAVINAWASSASSADIAPGCGDGIVAIDDLFAIINSWGLCP